MLSVIVIVVPENGPRALHDDECTRRERQKNERKKHSFRDTLHDHAVLSENQIGIHRVFCLAEKNSYSLFLG